MIVGETWLDYTGNVIDWIWKVGKFVVTESLKGAERMELLKKWIFRGEVLLPDSSGYIHNKHITDKCFKPV